MRVLAIILTRTGAYSETIRTTVLRALRDAGIDHDVVPLGTDISTLPRYDIYLGVGDEFFWRHPTMIPPIREKGGIIVDMRSRYMARKPKNLWRWLTDHRGRGADWVLTHLPSAHPRAHYVGQCVNKELLYPEHDDRFTVFIDHYMPKRRSVLDDILAQCAAIKEQRPDVRFWHLSEHGIVEDDFTERQTGYQSYPFEEIAQFYRRTHVLLPTHRETQGMLAAEIGMCGGLTLLRPWMYPNVRRKEVPHLTYRSKLVLPDTVDIAANRAHALAHFSHDAFAARIKAGLIKAYEARG